MDAMRVTGLMSGLDVNSIVDAYMTSAKAPIVKMNQKIDELSFEQDTYNKFIKMITDVKDSMLPLKMESTFKSKITTSSKEEVATGTASINTPPGSYNLNVTQTAEPAYANSLIVKQSVGRLGAGIKNLVYGTVNMDKYNQLEGVHEVKVSENASKDPNHAGIVIKDKFVSNDNSTYTVSKGGGTVLNGSVVDAKTGKVKDDIKVNDAVMLVQYNDELLQVPINLDIKKGETINTISKSLNDQINTYIDIKKGNRSGAQTVKVTLDYDNKGNFSFNFYDVDKTNKVEVAGMMGEKELKSFLETGKAPDIKDPNLSATTKLMFNLGVTFTAPATETKEIVDHMVAEDLSKVEETFNGIKDKDGKITTPNKGSFFYPNTIEFDKKGPELGMFKIYQDSSSIPRFETPTGYYGGVMTKVTKGVPGAPDKGGTDGKPATPEQIEKWLSEPIGKPTINFFDQDIETLKKLKGDFYINDVKIEIGDVEKLSPNELMAKVNSSGAGVKMSYDYENNAFRIENTEKGPKELKLGNGKDTSNFLEVFKVGVNTGGMYVRGQDAGKLDTSKIIGEMQVNTNPPISTGTFTINGVSIYVDIQKDSIDDVLAKVNKSGAGVTMTYDAVTDKFSLRAEDGDRIKVGGPKDTSTFLLMAGLTATPNDETVVGSPSKKAQFTLNGVKYERNTNNVKDIVPGLDFTINGVGQTIFSVKTDSERAVKAVAEWAGKYNTLINALNPPEIAYNSQLRDQYGEPLTDEKKANMSEEEIKKYNENHEKIVYHDLVQRSSELRFFKQSLRRELTKHVVSSETSFKSLDQIGIFIAGSDTHDIEVTKLGFLLDAETDPEKLEKVLKDNKTLQNMVEQNSNDVFKFFAGVEDSISKNPLTGQVEKKSVNVGYARVFGDYLDKNSNSSSTMYKKASKNGSIESEIRTIKKSIDSQTRRVEMYLERLYAEFAAMEQRVGALQQSASYLTGLSSPGANQGK